jgi:hypothetical protein
VPVDHRSFRPVARSAQPVDAASGPGRTVPRRQPHFN